MVDTLFNPLDCVLFDKSGLLSRCSRLAKYFLSRSKRLPRLALKIPRYYEYAQFAFETSNHPRVNTCTKRRSRENNRRVDRVTSGLASRLKFSVVESVPYRSMPRFRGIGLCRSFLRLEFHHRGFRASVRRDEALEGETR